MQLINSRRYSGTTPVPFNIAPKRMVDLGLGLTMSLLLAPVLLLVALVLCLQGGAVIYGHRRVGHHGREFTVWKFRTMVCEADQKLPQLLEGCPRTRRAWVNNRKLDNDPRITRVGRLLRRTSLDELPQLWNVLCGEMSLVGPRPVPRDELSEKYGLTARAYETVKPGMTGLWQVSGRNSLTYAERVALDQRYILTRTAWLDAKILWRTLWTVFRCNGS
ncbi:sugar transferase [Litoreibacter janthinus]|uniref:Sugar transferase involved in LPS biosynthesis (Colanic, teichoic acid) n=1 Tax=Litoreibacter janthinus TaxID=670154 RepID=A0A1I6ID06_9RHOB|nr:sugar transferase [Litoreibacter janthinus]SFR64566.1 Sugar transferase involved in LPS biosynthesis (colanic, teichoic acid) [Litoreibacter janthinus]